MTKHLRLIMLSLLAMICMGGYSAVGDTYKLVTSVNDLHDGDVIAIANSEFNKAMGKQRTNNRGSELISFIDTHSLNSVVAISTIMITRIKNTSNIYDFLLIYY